MSQNPRGSDPYDYNPDYNRLNEHYNQEQSLWAERSVRSGFWWPVRAFYDPYSPTSTVRIRGQDCMIRISTTRMASSTKAARPVRSAHDGSCGLLQKTSSSLPGYRLPVGFPRSWVLSAWRYSDSQLVAVWSAFLILGVIGIFKANEAERGGCLLGASLN